MKKLNALLGGSNPKKPDKVGALYGKQVQVGKYIVLVEDLLGEGGFACIYRAKECRTEQFFALKHFQFAGNPEHMKEVQREVKVMAKLRGHPNVLLLHAASFAGPPNAETDGFCLLDLCTGSLVDVMKQRDYQLSNELLLEVFSSVCAGVEHMHRQNPPIAHRDLKAENILRAPDGRWVICDFGSASTDAKVYESSSEIAREEEHINRTTTPAYRAPEMWDLYSRKRVDCKVDIWALGVLLYYLSFGKLPFPPDSKLAVINGNYRLPPEGSLTVRSPPLCQLIKDMLQTAPELRPSISEVLQRVQGLGGAAPVPGPQQPPRAHPLNLPAAGPAQNVSPAQRVTAQAPVTSAAPVAPVVTPVSSPAAAVPQSTPAQPYASPPSTQGQARLPLVAPKAPLDYNASPPAGSSNGGDVAALRQRVAVLESTVQQQGQTIQQMKVAITRLAGMLQQQHQTAQQPSAAAQNDGTRAFHADFANAFPSSSSSPAASTHAQQPQNASQQQNAVAAGGQGDAFPQITSNDTATATAFGGSFWAASAASAAANGHRHTSSDPPPIDWAALEQPVV